MHRLTSSTRWVLLVILMPMYTAANAQYYNDDKICYGFGGTIVSPMKHVMAVGGEASFNVKMFNNFYLGVYVGILQGDASTAYGYILAPNTSPSVTIDNLGFALSYKIANVSNTQAFAISCLNGVEVVELGDMKLSALPRSVGDLYRYHINVYRGVATNLYYSVRPGLRYFMPNKYFMVGIQYNFLIGITTFGRTTDFQGFQFIAGIKTGNDKKKKRSHYY